MNDGVTRLVEADGEGWVVRSRASNRVSFRTANRADAVARAKEIVRNLGGGRVEIRGRDGAVEQLATVVPRPPLHRRPRTRNRRTE